MEFRGHWEVLHSGFSGGKLGIKTCMLSVVGYGYFLELLISCEITFINTLLDNGLVHHIWIFNL